MEKDGGMRTVSAPATWLGMVSRLASKVLKPRSRSVNVRYWSGGPVGSWNINPMMYIGQRSKSFNDFHRAFQSMACLLCISPLDGSSRRIRFVMITSSRSVNHPFGRYHALVCVGDGAIANHDQMPMRSVMQPSMRNSQRQPSRPCNPRMRRMPNARIGATTSTTRRVVQKSARRKGNSVPLKKYDFRKCKQRQGQNFFQRSNYA